MSTVVSTSEIKFTKTPAGVLRIGETRVSLDSVICAFKLGLSPEEIVLDFDSLSLSEVYAAISYYLQNRKKVESYLSKRSAKYEQLKETVERRTGSKGLRDRLLARKS